MKRNKWITKTKNKKFFCLVTEKKNEISDAEVEFHVELGLCSRLISGWIDWLLKIQTTMTKSMRNVRRTKSSHYINWTKAWNLFAVKEKKKKSCKNFDKNFQSTSSESIFTALLLCQIEWIFLFQERTSYNVLFIVIVAIVLGHFIISVSAKSDSAGFRSNDFYLVAKWFLWLHHSTHIIWKKKKMFRLYLIANVITALIDQIHQQWFWQSSWSKHIFFSPPICIHYF